MKERLESGSCSGDGIRERIGSLPSAPVNGRQKRGKEASITSR